MSRLGVGGFGFCVLAVLVCAPCFPQASTATLLGTIRDPSGAVVPNALITVRNVDTNVKNEAQSDELGRYLVPLLPPGNYEIVVELAGFRRCRRTGITLHVNQRAREDFELQIGEITETVDIEADTSPLDQDSSTLGAVIDQDQVVELPLNGRDFFHLTYLVPGAAPGVDGSFLTEQFGVALSVHGMREDSNGFLLDGVENNEVFNNHVAASPPLDSVREFKVQSGNYSAEFGNHAGAQLNFVTRSGTNRLRGSAYAFHRNAALDAKNFFDLPDEPIPKFIRNQFGFSLGGPMIKNRTFLFGNYEGLRERKAITRLATVPPVEFISGDFSSWPDPILDPRTNSSGLPGCFHFQTGAPLCDPFEGNIIPTEAMDPVGSAIAAFYPPPNRGSSQFLSQPNREIDRDQIVIRVDHELTEKDSLFGRYAYFDEYRFAPFGVTTNLPGFGEFWTQHGQNAVVGWIHSFGPQLINDLRVAYCRSRSARFHETMGNDISSELGIKELSKNPLEVGFPATWAIRYDYLSEDVGYPHDNVDNLYQLVEGLSWHKGRHIFKIGADIRHVRENILASFFPRGTFVYTGDRTGHPIADLILGKPLVVYGGWGDGHANLRNWSFSIYFQDDFKIADNLTLNYGLRYEYSQPPFEVSGGFSQPDLRADSARFIRCGSEGIPRGCVHDDKNNFAPRIGFAWKPFSETNVVIRGGYGIFYEVGFYLSRYGLWMHPPDYTNPVSYFPASLSEPFTTGIGDPLVSPYFNPRDFPLAYAQQWNLNLQRAFLNTLLEVGYAGSEGTKLLARSNQNQMRPDGTRPYLAYSYFNGREAGAASSYHALYLRAERKPRSGLSIRGSYAFSKSIDDASAILGYNGTYGFPQNSYDRGAERGLSDFDNRHRLAISFLYQLPVGRSRQYLTEMNPFLQALLGGWQLTGIVAFRSSRPFSAWWLYGTEPDGRRPDLVGNPHLDSPDPSMWINTDAFELPDGFFGNAGRNILRGPGFRSVDVGLMKEWRFSEASRVQFRAEFFNLFNHPNFDSPEGDFSSLDFGRVQSAKDSRQIQFGLRVEF